MSRPCRLLALGVLLASLVTSCGVREDAQTSDATPAAAYPYPPPYPLPSADTPTPFQPEPSATVEASATLAAATMPAATPEPSATPEATTTPMPSVTAEETATATPLYTPVPTNTPDLSHSLTPTANISSSPDLQDAISDISFVDARHGWMATKNTVLHTNDKGVTWEKVATLHDVSKLSFISHDDGWAVANERLLMSHDGGRGWQKLTSAPGNVWRLHFINSREGWMVLGQRAEAVLFTHDGGITWGQIAEACGSPLAGYSGPIVFLTRFRGWQGCYVQGIAGLRPNTLSATTDGGKTWNELIGYDYHSLRPALPAEGWAYELTCVDSHHAWMLVVAEQISDGVHLSHLTATTDGWNTWAAIETVPAGLLHYLVFVSAQQGYVTAVQTNKTALYSTRDGGQSWQEIYHIDTL